MSVQYYHFDNTKPGTHRLRNGVSSKGERGLTEWTRALNGHVRVSHGGKELDTCPACSELRRRVTECSL